MSHPTGQDSCRQPVILIVAEHSSKEFELLCDACIADEKAGAFGNFECFDTPLFEAPLFSSFSKWQSSIEATYKSTFSDLVYGDLPEMARL